MRPMTTTTRRAVRTRMAIKEISMPALSSTMTEGKIVSWLMSEGDAIGKGDAVVVVEEQWRRRESYWSRSRLC